MAMAVPLSAKLREAGSAIQRERNLQYAGKCVGTGEGSSKSVMTEMERAEMDAVVSARSKMDTRVKVEALTGETYAIRSVDSGQEGTIRSMSVMMAT